LVIDRTHRKWGLATAAALLLSLIAFAITSPRAGPQPFGGTWTGITLGVFAFVLMLLAALLGLRKRFLGLRIVRTQTWMRGHLWLGFLSFPVMLFHSGFHGGGTLTTVLLWLATIVTVSGVAGAVLQHVLPQLITREVPLETIFEQIPHVREQLRDEAQGLVQPATAPAPAAKAAAPGQAAPAVVATQDENLTQPLQHFWEFELSPFLLQGNADSVLAKRTTAEFAFRQLRTALPAEFHPTVNSLEALAEEARQLGRQETLHYWLHGWLFIHVPLSYSLLALSAVHAVQALRY
jgi:hypothetical protein